MGFIQLFCWVFGWFDSGFFHRIFSNGLTVLGFTRFDWEF